MIAAVLGSAIQKGLFFLHPEDEIHTVGIQIRRALCLKYKV